MKIKQQNNQLIIGYLFALAATIIWSGNFIIARGLSDRIPPVSLAFWRWVVAVIVFLPFALRSLISEWGKLKKNILYLSVVSILGITIFNTLIYIAGQTTTAINLSLISITFPVFIVIISRIFLYESITFYKAIGILFVLTGVVLLITKGDSSVLLNTSFTIGDIWMLLASIIFAIYSILLKRKPEELSIWAFQLSTFILGLIFLFPFYILEYFSVPKVEFDIKTVSSILYVGIFASLTAFVLWNKAIVSIGPTKASMIYYTLPVFSGFLAFLFLKEEISRVYFYSTLFIVFGIFVANYESNNKVNKLK